MDDMLIFVAILLVAVNAFGRSFYHLGAFDSAAEALFGTMAA